MDSMLKECLDHTDWHRASAAVTNQYTGGADVLMIRLMVPFDGGGTNGHLGRMALLIPDQPRHDTPSRTYPGRRLLCSCYRRTDTPRHHQEHSHGIVASCVWTVTLPSTTRRARTVAFYLATTVTVEEESAQEARELDHDRKRLGPQAMILP